MSFARQLLHRCPPLQGSLLLSTTRSSFSNGAYLSRKYNSLFQTQNNNNNQNQNRLSFPRYHLLNRHQTVSQMSTDVDEVETPAHEKQIYDLSLLDRNDRIIVRARTAFGIKKLPGFILGKSSTFLYEACVDKVSVEPFIQHLDLPDTLATWFLITRLHVWMVMVRCKREMKANAEELCYHVVACMWADLNARIDKLNVRGKAKRQAQNQFYEEFNATLFALDEGLLSSDMVLAGALWRTLLASQPEPDPQHLALMVDYVRAQLEHLHRTVKSDQLLLKGLITWKPYPPLMPVR